MDKKPFCKREIDWKGIRHVQYFYLSDNFEELEPKKQVQAVCFNEKGEVVIYRHIDGYWGLPGGGIETDEDYDLAIRREILEEVNAEVLELGPIGYIKDCIEENSQKYIYQLRVWAKVKLLNGPVNDPCGKAIERMSYDKEKTIELLGWGELGRALIEEASKKVK